MNGQVLWTASELRFAQLACSNEDKDDAYAKEE